VTRGEIAFAIISGLLVNEATDICPWLSIRLVRWTARLRYPHAPERAATRGEELAALINDRPGKLFKLFTAVGFALHAVVMLRKNQQRVPISGWQAAAKRTFDIGVAVVALMVLLPGLAVVALTIRLTSPGPVFFSQERVTKGGRVFRLYKFRTMRTADPRPTRVGRFLRRVSMDELPYLWNVLKGDMSLVGPRPLRVDQVAANSELLSPNLEVPAGIIGLGQIQDRSDMTAEEAVKFDKFYIENWSFGFDIFIIAFIFIRTYKERRRSRRASGG
jgi:lipopolysaccharide/colanic/teichoic acid biosynthesis glycosyltransferase